MAGRKRPRTGRKTARRRQPAHWVERERPIVRLYGRNIELDVRIADRVQKSLSFAGAVRRAVAEHIESRSGETYHSRNIAIYTRGDGTIVVVPGET